MIIVAFVEIGVLGGNALHGRYIVRYPDVFVIALSMIIVTRDGVELFPLVSNSCVGACHTVPFELSRNLGKQYLRYKLSQLNLTVALPKARHAFPTPRRYLLGYPRRQD